MWVWVDRLGVFALDVGVAAVLIWSVAALATLLSRQPARRLMLARAAAVGSLATLPLIGLHLVPQFDPFAACERLGLFAHPLAPGPSEEMAEDVGAGFTPGPGAAAPWPDAVGVWPARVVTLVYAAGVACLLGGLALGCAGLAWLDRHSGDPSAGARALLESLPFPPGRRRPRLRISARVRRPALVRVVRPTILIPPGLDIPASSDRLRLSLLHELAHAESGDPFFGLLVNLAQAFWYFVPPVWWVGSRMRLDQEFLADRRAAQSYGPPRRYASSLLELASGPPGVPDHAPDAPAPAGDDAGGSPLFQRVLMLLRCPFAVESRPPAFWSWGLPWLTVVLTVAGSSLSIRYPAAEPRAPAGGHTFLVSRLEIPPSDPSEDGRCPPVDLPFQLPDRFDLTVEVWGDLSTLARTRLAGLAVRSPRPDASPDPPGWHSVRLRRDRRGVSLQVDGEPAPSGPDAPPRLTPRLSVEAAPRRPASCRNLKLTW